jgi:multidrug transporter EmrE-like cation transporter
VNRAINHKSLFDFIYIFAVIVLTVCGQLILKWQVAKAGVFPQSVRERALFLLRLVFNPWIIGGLFAGFLAFLCWMAALTKFELSYAYPFMSLAFVLVLLSSALLFHEAVTMAKMFGILLIMTGIIIASRG